MKICKNEKMKRKNSKSLKESCPNIEKILNETLRHLEDQTTNIEDIKNLDSLKNFQKNLQNFNESKKSNKNLICHWDIIILCILNLIFATYLAFFLSAYFSNEKNFKTKFSTKLDESYKWFIKQWMYFNEFTDLTQEECAVILPDYFNSITRPIDDCSMCQNLTEIKRIKNISKEEFLEKYAYTAVPVVITDAITEWSALNVINFDFLKNLYSNLEEREYRNRQSKLEIHEEKSSAILKTFNYIIEEDKQRSDSKITCQFFPYKTKFKNLQQVFEMPLDENGKSVEPWYVGWSNCNNYASKVLRQHYERPYFLPDESEMSRLDWIFMGTPGYGAAIHIDDVNNPSWQAQISGIKHWTFRPPAECLHKCPFNLYADVYPGDIIVFDSNRWFHSTLIIGNDISLTIGSEYD